MTNQIEVQPADVLLFRGDSWVSKAIRWFDRSDVNHAAIALGPSRIGEANFGGLETTPLNHAIGKNSRTILMRHVDGPDSALPVAIANQYMTSGVPYGFHQIVLLALLSVTRQIPLPGLARRLVRSALDSAADVLGAYLDSDAGNRFMICSEYVYRCYDEASNIRPDPYDLGLDLAAAPQLAAAGDDRWMTWALQQPQGVVDEATAIVDDSRSALAGRVVDVASIERDLEKVIEAYAVEAASANPTIAADVPESALAAAPLTEMPEPDDAQLLASHISFARALQATRDDAEAAVPLGLGTDLALGLLRGLINVEASPNFVTPGDLHVRATKLEQLDDLEG